MVSLAGVLRRIYKFLRAHVNRKYCALGHKDQRAQAFARQRKEVLGNAAAGVVAAADTVATLGAAGDAGDAVRDAGAHVAGGGRADELQHPLRDVIVCRRILERQPERRQARIAAGRGFARLIAAIQSCGWRQLGSSMTFLFVDVFSGDSGG